MNSFDLMDWQIEEVRSLVTPEQLKLGGVWKTIELEPLHYYSCCENLNLVIHHSYYDSRGQRRKARLMSLRPDFDGYLMCSFKGKAIRFHRLKAQIFLEDYDESLEVNHKDCDKQNNRTSNLEMTTHKENIQHFYTDPQAAPHREKRKESRRKFLQSERGKLQEIRRIQRLRDPAVRKHHSDMMKAYYSDETNRKKTSQSLKHIWQDPEKRMQRSESMRNQWQDPKFRSKMISSHTRREEG